MHTFVGECSVLVPTGTGKLIISEKKKLCQTLVTSRLLCQDITMAAPGVFPESFYCPITQEVMQDPVVDPGNSTFPHKTEEKTARKKARMTYSQ